MHYKSVTSYGCYAVLVSIVLFLVLSTNSAPSSISFAGDSGAYASAGNPDGSGTLAIASPSGSQAGTLSKDTSNSAGGSSSGVLSSRLGGGSSSSPSNSKMQSVVMGSNGDTTILQQNGDQPVRVYKIPASG